MQSDLVLRYLDANLCQLETRNAARSSSGHDVREITGYSIRGFSVIEFESPGSRALIVRVTLDYIAARARQFRAPSISAVLSEIKARKRLQKMSRIVNDVDVESSASEAINRARVNSFRNLIVRSFENRNDYFAQ